MKTVAASVNASASLSVSASASVRYSFGPQYVGGALLLAERALAIEQQAVAPLDMATHRALVVGAVMQASAALESELAEALEYGPGRHTEHPSSSPQIAGVEAKAIARAPGGIIERWNLLLKAVGKPPLRNGDKIVQEAALLVSLRNELVHYQSFWDGATARTNLVKSFRAKRLGRAPFISPLANEFPNGLLSAACARWAALAAINFLDAAYCAMGIASPLDGHRLSGADFESIMTPNATKALVKKPKRTSSSK